jgi:hypothetical protein
MSAFSNYLENEILDWVNGGAFPSQPSATWVQLFNGSPTEAGGGGTALYTRAAVAAGGWTTTTGSTATITNTTALIITSSAGSSAVADNFGIFDSSAGGNLLFLGAIGTPKTISVGDEIKFNASQLTIRID